MDESAILATFLGQIILLMLCGRLLGEGMARIGQPALFGQLLAGVLLGPSAFGALLPDLHAFIFPDSEILKTMIDAISQVGILLLLLVTGMETNIELVRRRFRVVAATSVSGIAVPFACGLALGFLIPESLVPDEGRRLVTALFIGTALSISSVKIVAMVLMEVGFIRRDLGQLILATAILDDSIAWIMVSVIAGMAARGQVDLGEIGLSIVAAGAFLGFSLTIGRRLVARLIRWSNDSLVIEFPVITAALVVTFAMALATDLIGVHSALGAFISGVIIGQAPILKGHIEQELRGLILAFFSPVFFAVAGLGMDLTTLGNPAMLGLALAFVAIASLGKTAGAMIGGRVAGLSNTESLALATGLNARGSTEVIIATIGMSLGVLSEPLYTLIVAMAIITTMAMPPTLRWALGRVRLRPEERDRLEREEAAEADQLTAMERALVLADRGANARMTAQLAGAFASGRQMLTTVLEPGPEAPPSLTEIARDSATAADAMAGGAEGVGQGDTPPERPKRLGVEVLIQQKRVTAETTGADEAEKGYNLLFAGLDRPFADDARHFAAPLAELLERVDLPLAIGVAGRHETLRDGFPRRILAATDGTRVATLATEIAVALARAGGGQLTLLHVVEHSPEGTMAHELRARPGTAVLHEAEILARRNGVRPELREMIGRQPNRIIRRLARNGPFDLIVVGAALRQDGGRSISPRASELVQVVNTPLLLVAQ